MDIYNEQTMVLIQRLSSIEAGKETNLYTYIASCALDIICGSFVFFVIFTLKRIILEAAMGLNIGAQEKRNSQYIDAVLK